VSKNRDGSGQNDAREIENQIETRTGHPTSQEEDSSGTEAKGTREELADAFLGVATRSHQHSRKGQAESPRELTLNQPETKHGKNR
jgi:hypothetical protein